MARVLAPLWAHVSYACSRGRRLRGDNPISWTHPGQLSLRASQHQNEIDLCFIDLSAYCKIREARGATRVRGQTWLTLLLKPSGARHKKAPLKMRDGPTSCSVVCGSYAAGSGCKVTW